MVGIMIPMPKSCAYCPLNDSDCYCNGADMELKVDYDRTRPDYCPLIDLTDDGK